MKLIGKFAGFLFWTSVAVLGALSFLRFVPVSEGQYAWRLNLLEQFRHLLALVQLLLILPFLLVHPNSRLKLIKLAVLLLFFLPNLLVLGPYYWPQDRAPSGETIKVLYFNVWGKNEQVGKVAELIRNQSPDVLVLSEYNQYWKSQLEQTGALKAYSSQVVFKYGNDAIYSKFPLKDVNYDFFRDDFFNMTTYATAFVSGKSVSLIVTHPKPPLKEKWWSRQQEIFEKISARREALSYPLILIGDLNSVSWAPGVQRLMHTLGLKDSQLGFGVQPSWGPLKSSWKPVRSPVKLIPIDHVFVSSEITVINRKLGPNIGSDHLPVIVELGL